MPHKTGMSGMGGSHPDNMEALSCLCWEWLLRIDCSHLRRRIPKIIQPEKERRKRKIKEAIERNANVKKQRITQNILS